MDNDEKVSPQEFERQVFLLEQIKIVVYSIDNVPKYGFRRGLPDTKTVTVLRKRIETALGPGIKFTIVLGGGIVDPHGGMKLGTIREVSVK